MTIDHVGRKRMILMWIVDVGRKSGGCRRCLSPLVALGSALLCGPVERRLLCNPPSSSLSKVHVTPPCACNSFTDFP